MFVPVVGYQWPSIVQQTEIIPYLAITDVPLQTQGESDQYKSCDLCDNRNGDGYSVDGDENKCGDDNQHHIAG